MATILPQGAIHLITTLVGAFIGVLYHAHKPAHTALTLSDIAVVFAVAAVTAFGAAFATATTLHHMHKHTVTPAPEAPKK